MMIEQCTGCEFCELGRYAWMEYSYPGCQPKTEKWVVRPGTERLDLSVDMVCVFDFTKPSITIQEVLPASPAGPLPRGNFNTVRVLAHFEQNNWVGADRMTAWGCEADDRPGMFVRNSCQAQPISKTSPDVYLNPTLGLRGNSDCSITKVKRVIIFLTPTNEGLQIPSSSDPYKSEAGLNIWARAERSVDWTYQPCN